MLLFAFLIAALLCGIFALYKKLLVPYLGCQVPLDKVSRASTVYPKRAGETLVVVGGSFSGLFSAISLSKYFKDVIIIDKYQFEEGKSIVGAIQGEQPHIFCYRSLDILERVFPGFEKDIDEMLKKNKINQVINLSKNFYYDFQGIHVSDASSTRNKYMYLVNRSQLEALIRRRIRAELKNISFLENVDLTKEDIVYSVVDGKEHMSGIVLPDKSVLKADLFVIANGLGGSRLMANSSQKSSISKTEIRCPVQYQAIKFRPKTESIDGDGHVPLIREKEMSATGRSLNDPYHVVYHILTHPFKKGILAMPCDGEHILITMDAYNGTPRGVDVQNAKEKILDYCSDYPRMHSDMVEVLEKLEDNAVEIVKVFRKVGSEINDFTRFNVSGVVFVGDVVGSLNPIYGQGITLGADSALILEMSVREYLESNQSHLFGSETFCKEYHSKSKKAYLVPWIIATSMDLMYNETEFTKDLSWQHKLCSSVFWLTKRLFTSASRYPQATNYLLRVLYLEEGFRWRVFNPIWHLGYVFRMESLLALSVISTIVLAAVTLQ